MSDLRVSFPMIETSDGRTSLDARSFRQAALALASGQMPRQPTPRHEPVYIVAPERRRLLASMLAVAIAAAAVSAILVWLL